MSSERDFPFHPLSSDLGLGLLTVPDGLQITKDILGTIISTGLHRLTAQKEPWEQGLEIYYPMYMDDI
jgi:hypothetical protein